MSDTEDNLMDFSVEITKQLIRGGETFQSELLGKWQTTGHVTPDSTVLAEYAVAASFFSAQKVYQVAIVVVKSFDGKNISIAACKLVETEKKVYFLCKSIHFGD